MNYLSLIDRKDELFEKDIIEQAKALDNITSESSFLVIGGPAQLVRL